MIIAGNCLTIYVLLYLKAIQSHNLIPTKFNLSPVLKTLKIGLGRFLEQFPDTPPTRGYIKE